MTGGHDGGREQKAQILSPSLAALDSPLPEGAFGVVVLGSHPLYTRGSLRWSRSEARTPHSTMTFPLFRSARSSRIMRMASATGSLVWAPVVMFLQDTMPAAISSSPKNST